MELVGNVAGVHIITWRLGEEVSVITVQSSLYSVVVTGIRGNFVGTYSVRFAGTEDSEVITDVHDLGRAARGPSRVGDEIVEGASVSIQFFDAGIGLEPHQHAYADVQVNGVLMQERLPLSVPQD